MANNYFQYYIRLSKTSISFINALYLANAPDFTLILLLVPTARVPFPARAKYAVRLASAC
jgi:hypothetical protein